MRQIVFMMLLSLVMTLTASAVDVAPRISDREIIESLAEIKGEQKTLRAEMNGLRAEMNARFDAQQKEINGLRSEMNNRFDDMQKQMDRTTLIMVTLFAAQISLMGVLIGFVVWDRRTMVKPLEIGLQNLNAEFARDRTQRVEESSLFASVLEVFREMAKFDVRLADILRAKHLL